MGTTERRERSKHEMKRLILDTAKRLFISEGFDKVSMRRIAEVIEYSPATIYLYFNNKEDIFRALQEAGFEELYRRQQAVFDVPHPMERLGKHAHIYIQFALDNPEYYDLMFIMRHGAQHVRDTREWETGLRSYKLMEDNVRDCVEAGLLRAASVEAATLACWSFVHGIAALVIRDRLVMVPPTHVEVLAHAIVDFVLENFSR
jgi:AcrR family transcriptional regulator